MEFYIEILLNFHRTKHILHCTPFPSVFSVVQIQPTSLPNLPILSVTLVAVLLHL